ncbi:uncharacterized protein LOC131253677 isoform X2 [Magnolia sinica]|uniref:uncharacterized protein LOC131253677 isoform X2 n=1 Tax=Magnolia sinica TaxID=86752 RepID=UPI00265840C5|nr:uncharacterized protein LOC131253677 isoform X2 [Magnolia sinica]
MSSLVAILDSSPYEYTSMKNLNESKYGFWGVLTRKAKSIIEDDNAAQQTEMPSRSRPQMLETSTGGQFHQSYRSPEGHRKIESPKIQKGFDAITSSLNYIGNALEEGITIVENKTADILSETRKLHIRRKGGSSNAQNEATNSPHQQLQMQTGQEMQLKASRDVAMAMAAKAKLLLRELKTVKADLAFAKERCAQLEEENKILRESHERGDNPEDDDLIRLQLETLLAEKARLAHENSVYARENRFLREIVEYHQLTMQDVVYLDEGIEEVKEVSPIPISPTADVRPFSTPPPSSPSATTPKGSGPASMVLDSRPVPMPPPGSEVISVPTPSPAGKDPKQKHYPSHPSI